MKRALWTCPTCGRPIESILDRGFIQSFRLTDASQLDDELMALVREGYAVGSQD
jgi:hypothetical protein